MLINSTQLSSGGGIKACWFESTRFNYNKLGLETVGNSQDTPDSPTVSNPLISRGTESIHGDRYRENNAWTPHYKKVLYKTHIHTWKTDMKF